MSEGKLNSRYMRSGCRGNEHRFDAGGLVLRWGKSKSPNTRMGKQGGQHKDQQDTVLAYFQDGQTESLCFLYERAWDRLTGSSSSSRFF